MPGDSHIQNGIYRLSPSYIEDFLSDPPVTGGSFDPDFFPGPLAFLQAWKRGYETGKSQVHDWAKGFELYLPSGSMLASDINGFIVSHMSLGVNYRDRQVLVYKPHEKVSIGNQGKWKQDTFMRDEGQYIGADRYPLDSHNSLKAVDKQWVMFGIPAEGLYDALAKMGFIFPE